MYTFVVANGQTFLLLQADTRHLRCPGCFQVQGFGDGTLSELNLLAQGTEQHGP